MPLRLVSGDLLELGGSERRCTAVSSWGVVELVAPGEHDLAGLGLAREAMAGRHLVFEGDSAAALSKQDPTRPIDCRMPSRARSAGGFDNEIVSIAVVDRDGRTVSHRVDETVRATTTAAGLAGLKPSFEDPALSERFPEIEWNITGLFRL